MCLIVDANVVAETFTPRPSPDFAPVWKALLAGKATAVWGGQLVDEYLRLRKHVRLILELARQGKIRRVADADVNAKSSELRANGNCVSDDPHIIALALVSGVRLLCSRDQALHADFTNPDLLRPQGSVYQNADHSHLITKHCSKRKSKPQKKARLRRGATVD